MKKVLGLPVLLLTALIFVASCGSKSSNMVSSKTGWNYNDKDLGGFEVPSYEGQYVGPGLKFVEGGTFTMGQTDEDLTYEDNNRPRRVSVSSFFMDETEVANVHYREYLYWLRRVTFSDYPEIYSRALPDTQSWRSAMQYNEPLVEHYFSHAAYNYYPVVGVNWNQATEYCKWRSDRVNERILIEKGYLKKNPFQVSDDNFNTKTYTIGQYEGLAGKKKKDLDPTGGGERNIGYADGILLPDYRLPTEAEWEYAALGLIGRNPEPDSKRRRGEEIVTDRKVYPWNDNNSTRNGMRDAYQGEFLGNFRRSNGDMMGVAGGLNDNADIPGPIYGFKANAFGLYHMAGNVAEWVMDVYRPSTLQDADGHRLFRGNVYTTYKTLDDFTFAEKDSLGRMPKRLVTKEELEAKRKNYRDANVIGFLDGDSNSTTNYTYAYPNAGLSPEEMEKTSTLINDNAHVYKGGSWNDRAYWMSPGTRRFMQANHGSPYVGFRCCMDRLGSPTLHTPGGNYFGAFGNKIRK